MKEITKMKIQLMIIPLLIILVILALRYLAHAPWWVALFPLYTGILLIIIVALVWRAAGRRKTKW